MALVARVRNAIEQYRLLEPGEKLVVGVSGGPDSVCLLHAMRCLAPELRFHLHVAHLNHQMRGAESDADAAFVVGLAAEWGLPATIETADVPALARAHHMAPEEAARRSRYAFLARVAGQVGAHTIAVAHNADDQVETVIMHWLRGSGLAGLRGMLPATPLTDLRLGVGEMGVPTEPSARELHSPSFGSRPLTLIRPLLDIPRSDIEAYCTAHNLEPRFDRSNLDTTYSRNRLRHELIPFLESYNPNIRQVLRRTASVVAADYELLREQLHAAWKLVVRAESDNAIAFDLLDWRGLPLALKRSTLREAIHRLRLALRNIDFIHVEHAVESLKTAKTGDQVTLPQGLLLTVGYDTFTIADEGYYDLPELPWILTDSLLQVEVPGCTRLPGTNWILRAEIVAHVEVPDQDLEAARGWEACLDAAFLQPLSSLRPRRPGDRFCPLGMGGRSKRLSEFMINEKIPTSWRGFVPLLVDERDRILWVCGWRPDERARVTPATECVARLRFERA